MYLQKARAATIKASAQFSDTEALEEKADRKPRGRRKTPLKERSESQFIFEFCFENAS